MLVSEYATEVINTRPYKYQTRQTFFKDLKRLGIWDLEVEKVNSALIRDVVEQLTTQSTRKRLYITARSIFRDLGICQDLLRCLVGKLGIYSTRCWTCDVEN